MSDFIDLFENYNHPPGAIISIRDALEMPDLCGKFQKNVSSFFIKHAWLKDLIDHIATNPNINSLVSCTRETSDQTLKSRNNGGLNMVFTCVLPQGHDHSVSYCTLSSLEREIDIATVLGFFKNRPDLLDPCLALRAIQKKHLEPRYGFGLEQTAEFANSAKMPLRSINAIRSIPWANEVCCHIQANKGGPDTGYMDQSDIEIRFLKRNVRYEHFLQTPFQGQGIMIKGTIEEIIDILTEGGQTYDLMTPAYAQALLNTSSAQRKIQEDPLHDYVRRREFHGFDLIKMLRDVASVNPQDREMQNAFAEADVAFDKLLGAAADHERSVSMDADWTNPDFLAHLPGPWKN